MMSSQNLLKSLKVKLKLLRTTGFVVIIVSVLAGILVLTFNDVSAKEDPYGYRLMVRMVEKDQWVYEIFYKERLLIRQHWVPGVEGKRAFTTFEKARQTGQLVIDKLKQNQLPAVSRVELKNKGIVD